MAASLPQFSNPSYKNITISGLPGGGSTTLLKGLKAVLEFDGWKGFSGGEFMRQYAVEKGLFDKNQKSHHSAQAYGEDFDRQVDLGMREKLETEDKWILESWLSGFMAQGITSTLKVLVFCSNDDVRIDRIMNRDGISLEEAKKNTFERYQNNYEKWSKMYASLWQEWIVDSKRAKSIDPIDFWREDLYDVVIDTYKTTKEETIQIVLDALQNPLHSQT